MKAVSSQIPVFDGSENGNVQRWLDRVTYVARLYQVPEDMLLLAATSKLADGAKK